MEQQAEEEVEGECAADDFVEVGGARDDLGLESEGDSSSAGQMFPEELGERVPGDETEFGALVLDEHGRQVRGDENPDEEVAVARRR